MRIHTRTCDCVVSFMFVAKLSSTSSFSPTLTQRQHFAPCGHSQPSSCHARINFSSPRHITASHAIAALPRVTHHTDSKNKFFSCNKICGSALRCSTLAPCRNMRCCSSNLFFMRFEKFLNGTFHRPLCVANTSHPAGTRNPRLRVCKKFTARVCDPANLMT